MKIINIILLSIMLTIQALAQTIAFESIDLKVNPLIEGTLLRPTDQSEVPLVIIIQGSGPTDRDGNQPTMQNNSLKMLAESLSQAGIASFRYDKRIMPMLRNGTLNEADLSFNDLVTDAKSTLQYFKVSSSFSGYYIAGHSQGSLIGILAAQDGIDGLISLAGPGQSIDEIVVDQLERQAPALAASAQRAFEDLRTTGKAETYSPGIASLFRPEIQPFMLSWIKFDPTEELAKLNCPVLLINGDKDLQIDPQEAQKLLEAKPDAQLEIITGMNHVLKTIEGGDMENAKSYNEAERPLSEELVPLIIDFVKK